MLPEQRPPASPAARHAALVDALAYLLDEVALLRRVLPRVPAPLQTDRPRPDLLSLRETFALIAARDAARTDALARPDGPLVPPADPPPDGLDADGLSADDLLDRVTAARETLGTTIAGWSDADWAREAATADGPASAEALVAGFVQHDAALLRALAEQLYDAQKLAG